MSNLRTLLLSVAFGTVALGSLTTFGQQPANYLSDPSPVVVLVDDVDESTLTMEQLADALEQTQRRLNELEAQREAILADSEETLEKLGDLEEKLEGLDGGKSKAEKEKKWFEKYTLRGYAQFRFNHILHHDDDSAAPQHVGDISVGDDQSFLIRRARLIFQADINDYVSVYLQPDFASTPNGSVDSIHFAQIRDWYGDLHFDKEKIHRLRVGQSKIPYGWENLQSSSNRLPLDRSDSLNSAAKNERDLGLFYYWTPVYAQRLFKYVLDEGLKGSGNYGVFGFGAYNGQGGSLREVNDELHVISRLAIPLQFDNCQVVEVGLQGYTGMYSVYGRRIRPPSAGSAEFPLGTIEQGDTRGSVDKRIAATFVYYPQPLGFQAEWTVGRGPSLNDDQTEVLDRALYGGYLMSMYRYETNSKGIFIPFARWNYYKGGYKSERNAPFSEIDEFETGLEWQISKAVEFVGMYTLTDRTNTRDEHTDGTLSYGQFEGELLRFQLQVNY